MGPTETSTSRAIEALVAAGHTEWELEGALGLSPGYLAKVRHGTARPSLHLVALLEVLRTHPTAVETVRAVTEAPRAPARRRAPRRARGSALRTLRRLVPVLQEVGVRWAVTGDVALALLCGPDRAGADQAGVDLVVDPRDRKVLELLRARGHALAHHPPELVLCRVPSADPNDTLRLHFPARPPLLDALEHSVTRDGLPVVDLDTLTLANLLSHRLGAEEAAAAGFAAGASVTGVRARLEELAGRPPPKSPYLLRTFDVALARRRLESRG